MKQPVNVGKICQALFTFLIGMIWGLVVQGELEKQNDVTALMALVFAMAWVVAFTWERS